MPVATPQQLLEAIVTAKTTIKVVMSNGVERVRRERAVHLVRTGNYGGVVRRGRVIYLREIPEKAAYWARCSNGAASPGCGRCFGCLRPVLQPYSPGRTPI